MSEIFEDILNDCLDRMTNGQSVEACLKLYDSYSRELAPLLEVVILTMNVVALPKYKRSAKAQGLIKLREQIRQTKKPNKSLLQIFMRPLTKPLMLGLFMILLASVTTGGTTIASANSKPGDTLYWIKTSQENLSLKLPRSDLSRAHRQATLANVRGEEMRKLLQEGNFSSAKPLISKIQKHLRKSAVYSGLVIAMDPIEMPLISDVNRSTSAINELRSLLTNDSTKLSNKLNELLSNETEANKFLITQFIRQSELRYRMILEAMDNEALPSKRVFWRVETKAVRKR